MSRDVGPEGSGEADRELAALLDLNWLRPDLAVGGRVPVETAELLALHLGIRRLVDLRAEEQDDPEVFRQHQIQVLHLPTLDNHAVSQEMLWTGVRWVEEGLSAGEKVLIHCEYGIGRSILLACCVLVSQGHHPLQALELIKNNRERASPSPEQLNAFLGWSADWYCRSQGVCPPVTWDELAEVAYRHLRGPEDRA